MYNIWVRDASNHIDYPIKGDCTMVMYDHVTSRDCPEMLTTSMQSIKYFGNNPCVLVVNKSDLVGTYDTERLPKEVISMSVKIGTNLMLALVIYYQ